MMTNSTMPSLMATMTKLTRLDSLMPRHRTPVRISTIAAAPTVNVGAAAIVLILTGVLCLGIKLSSRVNFVIVAIKLGIVLFVIIAGAFYVKTRLWHPFIPPSGSKPAPGGAESNTTPLIQTLFGYKAGAFGWSGVFSGAALVFFAYI